MDWIFKRLGEPSTHAGLAAIFVALASFFPAYATILNSVAGVLGLTAASKADGA
jgi:hypothetical protein